VARAKRALIASAAERQPNPLLPPPIGVGLFSFVYPFREKEATMGNEPEWEVNALLADGGDLVPCSIQDAGAESGESQPVRYVWAFPLKTPKNKPRTSLLGECDRHRIDAKTIYRSLSGVSGSRVSATNWVNCSTAISPSWEMSRIAKAAQARRMEDEEPSYPLMIMAEDHKGIMLGTWDGKRRDPDTTLPIVELSALRVRPDEGRTQENA